MRTNLAIINQLYIPLNHHFSHGIPMVFLWFSYGLGTKKVLETPVSSPGRPAAAGGVGQGGREARWKLTGDS